MFVFVQMLLCICPNVFVYVSKCVCVFFQMFMCICPNVFVYFRARGPGLGPSWARAQAGPKPGPGPKPYLYIALCALPYCRRRFFPAKNDDPGFCGHAICRKSVISCVFELCARYRIAAGVFFRQKMTILDFWDMPSIGNH